MLDVFALSIALSVGQGGAPSLVPAPDLPRNVAVPQVTSTPSAPARINPMPVQRSVISVDPMPSPFVAVQPAPLPADAKKDEPKNGNGEVTKDEEKKDEAPNDEGPSPWRLFPDPFCGFSVKGWVYGTGVYNASNGGGTRYNGPMTINDQEGVYLNQLWLNINKSLEKDKFGWGANVDLLFGNDYLSSESRGFENARARGWLPKWWDNQDYGLTIPQAYAEIGTSAYNIRAGHFYTPHGYMVVQATGNFFNTMPYGFMMTNPFTHWGVMANFAITDQVSGMFAVVNGWDALDRPANVASYMASLKYTFKDEKGYASTTVITGVEPENLGTGYGSRTLITNILDYKITEKDEIVLENNLLWQKNHVPNETSMSWSLIPYYFHKINDCWKIGGRYEIFYDPTGFISAERVGNPNNGPISSQGPYKGYMHSFTAGVNWNPNGNQNLLIRPEVRYDIFNSRNGLEPFNNNSKNNQLVFLLGAIYQF